MDGRLLGRPCPHSGNSQEWNIGVGAPQTLAMDRDETLGDPFTVGGLSQEDHI